MNLSHASAIYHSFPYLITKSWIHCIGIISVDAPTASGIVLSAYRCGTKLKLKLKSQTTQKLQAMKCKSAPPSLLPFCGLTRVQTALAHHLQSSGTVLWALILGFCLDFSSSPCPTRSTMATQSPWGTASSSGAWICSLPPCWRSSATGWKGSAPSRTWRSGRSTSCRSRPSTPSGQDRGAKWCEVVRGSLVSQSPVLAGKDKPKNVQHVMPFFCSAVSLAGPLNQNKENEWSLGALKAKRYRDNWGSLPIYIFSYFTPLMFSYISL